MLFRSDYHKYFDKKCYERKKDYDDYKKRVSENEELKSQHTIPKKEQEPIGIKSEPTEEIKVQAVEVKTESPETKQVLPPEPIEVKAENITERKVEEFLVEPEQATGIKKPEPIEEKNKTQPTTVKKEEKKEEKEKIKEVKIKEKPKDSSQEQLSLF